MNREILLGTTDDGERVTVQIALREVAAAGRQTVDHQTLTDKYMTELSIMGNVYQKGRYNDPVECGQCPDALDRIVTPESPWTLEEINELQAVWQRWHLNDVKAGCIHQTVFVSAGLGKGIDLDATTKINACPAEYRYGSAWLVEPLPADVIERVQRWQRRLKP